METEIFPWNLRISANLHYLREHALLKNFYQRKPKRKSWISGFLTKLVIYTQKYYWEMVLENQGKVRECQKKKGGLVQEPTKPKLKVQRQFSKLSGKLLIFFFYLKTSSIFQKVFVPSTGNCLIASNYGQCFYYPSNEKSSIPDL